MQVFALSINCGVRYDGTCSGRVIILCIIRLRLVSTIVKVGFAIFNACFVPSDLSYSLGITNTRPLDYLHKLGLKLQAIVGDGFQDFGPGGRDLKLLQILCGL